MNNEELQKNLNKHISGVSITLCFGKNKKIKVTFNKKQITISFVFFSLSIFLFDIEKLLVTTNKHNIILLDENIKYKEFIRNSFQSQQVLTYKND